MERKQRLFIATTIILPILICEGIVLGMHQTGLLPTWDNLEIIIPEEYQRNTINDTLSREHHQNTKDAYCRNNQSCMHLLHNLMQDIKNTSGLKTQTYRIKDTPHGIIENYHKNLVNKSYSLYNNTIGDTTVFGCPLSYGVYTKGPFLAVVVLAMSMGSESMVVYATGSIFLFQQIYCFLENKISIGVK